MSGVTVVSLIEHSKEILTKTCSYRVRTIITEVYKILSQTSLLLHHKMMGRLYLLAIHQIIHLQKLRTMAVEIIVRDQHALVDF
jgi:hypothetical protein